MPRRSLRPLLLKYTLLTSVSVAACAAPGDGPSVSSDAANDVAAACPAGQSLGITLVTEDGVNLIADLYVSDRPAGGPSVILLHMIPPSNSKANYPLTFAESLQRRGITVLNLNRRGAPGSGGLAVDAYIGAAGKLDAKAAYDYLTLQCKVGSYSLMGASNGTTTAVDFAVYAAANNEITPPISLVALSAGSYTETQNSIAAQASELPSRAFFAYPPSEAPWHEGIRAYVPSWTFSEYKPGAHGTGLFTSNPEISETIVQFLENR